MQPELHTDDTIFALATPRGRSAIAVLRLSGAAAGNALCALTFQPLPPPRMASLRKIHASDGTCVDEALCVYFPSPHSFTGEETVELQLHGSRAVIEDVISTLSAMPGLRIAEPGEFTRRALANGKMDLLQAEGLADLIDAETEAQARQARVIMEGHVGKHYEQIREKLVYAMALIEAYLDFPDEDIPAHVWQQARDMVNALQTAIEAILERPAVERKIREGFTIIILGAPNAGKSTLLNALAQSEAAIVSDIPGTTRDLIEVPVSIGGYAATIIDTAGLRETEDAIEAEGIRRARLRAQQADVKLIVFDASQLPSIDQHGIAEANDNTLVVFTKADIASETPPDRINGIPIILCSAKTSSGLESLYSAMREKIHTLAHTNQAPLLSRERHRYALRNALNHVQTFALMSEPELACEELRLAAKSIGNITGRITTDEILDSLFSSFCIGK